MVAIDIVVIYSLIFVHPVKLFLVLKLQMTPLSFHNFNGPLSPSQNPYEYEPKTHMNMKSILFFNLHLSPEHHKDM